MVPDPEMVDDDNPEITDEMFARAVRISDLPPSLRAKLGGRPKKQKRRKPNAQAEARHRMPLPPAPGSASEEKKL